MSPDGLGEGYNYNPLRAAVPEGGKLAVHTGKGHTTLRRQELEEYWGKRGTRLPCVFQKVDGVEVEV